MADTINVPTVERGFEYTEGKMYRTIKVTMPPCDTNDDDAWKERNELAEKIITLLQAPAQPAKVQGWQDGILVELRKVLGTDGTVYRNVKAMLAAAPQPSDDVAKDAARYRWLIEEGDNMQWMNIIRVEVDDYPSLTAAIDAAMGSKGDE